MTTQTIEQIELTDTGPIKHASIPYLPEGGLVVLRGPQGAGKTITLNALESAATGVGRPPIREGAPAAIVKAFGVTMIVGRSTQRAGEPEVSVLDGRLSVADLVDPEIKSPAAADAHRIKALVSIAGIKPSAELFYGLIGGREAFEAVVSPKATEGDDLVASAERIKREFEGAARKEEERAEHQEGRARGAREAANGVDAAAECDPDLLQIELEAAILLESDIKAKTAAHKKAALAARQAKDQIEDAESSYSGITLADAQETENAARANEHDAQEAVRNAEEALRTAGHAHSVAKVKLAAAIANRKAALQHEDMVAQWRDQIQASIPEAPAADELVTASQAVTTCRQAVEQGALIRKAREHLAQADEHTEAGTKHRQQAMALREAAKGIDAVLSAAVKKTGSPLTVEGGRLVTEIKGKKKLFGELSDGERWKLALDIAIDAIGDKGFIPIPQWAWGELQPANKKAIAAHLRERGVTGYTAEATDDEGFNAAVYAEN